MNKSPYDIIRHLVEKLVLPKHPTVTLSEVDSLFWGGRRVYDVRFLTKKELDSEIQEEIDTEIKTIFKMTSLDQIESSNGNRNIIRAWFKTPRQHNYNFTAGPNYSH